MAQLLDRVVTLTVFARLRGVGAGCSDGNSNGNGNGDACCGDSASNGRAAGATNRATEVMRLAATALEELLAMAGYLLRDGLSSGS